MGSPRAVSTIVLATIRSTAATFHRKVVVGLRSRPQGLSRGLFGALQARLAPVHRSRSGASANWWRDRATAQGRIIDVRKPKILVFSNAGSDFGLLDEKRQIALPVDELRNNLVEFMASLQEILPAADQTAAGMGLKNIYVAVGINGKGKFGFLGTGV